MRNGKIKKEDKDVEDQKEKEWKEIVSSGITVIINIFYATFISTHVHSKAIIKEEKGYY